MRDEIGADLLIGLIGEPEERMRRQRSKERQGGKEAAAAHYSGHRETDAGARIGQGPTGGRGDDQGEPGAPGS